MSNKEKLEAVIAFLKENNLEFEENHFSKSQNINIDLLVKPYRIAVHLSNEHDKMFYKRTKRTYHPFFIRENETVEFVLEKMQNCLIDEMKALQTKLNKEKEAEEKKKLAEKPKRQRVRIPHAERVTPMRKDK